MQKCFDGILGGMVVGKLDGCACQSDVVGKAGG